MTSRSTAPTSPPTPICAPSGWPIASTSGAGAWPATPSGSWTGCGSWASRSGFNLGDRDLAIGVHRAEALARGQRLTDAHRAIVRALGVQAEVLPASDHPVRTRVRAGDRWMGFQEFMIRRRGQGPLQDLDFHGARAAPPTDEVLAAIAGARAVVIGPSNPVASIAPILALPGLRDALRAAPAPVVAVSPLVHGTGDQGADGGVHALRRPAPRRRPASPPTTAR